MEAKPLTVQNQMMRNYYKFQSKIYDATRWSFLFGREKIFKMIPLDTVPKHIVEIGCGTGHNIRQLTKLFPHTQITGIDISTDMLKISRKKFQDNPKVKLIESAYGNQPSNFSQAPDLILFSYTLTMINPAWNKIILQAKNDLKLGGKIAVVDFHSTTHDWFKKHMGNNHVRMDGHLDDLLETTFHPIQHKIVSAYAGLWNYFYFVGEK